MMQVFCIGWHRCQHPGGALVLQDATTVGKAYIGSLGIISYNHMPICNCIQKNSLTNELSAYKNQKDWL